MLHRFFWSWLRRWFFRKPGPASNGQRPTRQPKRLGIEWLEDRAVPASAVAPSALIPSAFISTSYQALLGRDADAAGLVYWGNQLNAGATPTAVATGILSSTEFANDEVQSLYQSLLRRSASSSDQAYWVAQQQGGASWEQIEAAMLASDEYFQKSGGTLNSWVTQMFQDVLHRPLASGELSYFQQLSSPSVSRQTIALQIITSAEADKLQVLGDYSTILGRDGNTDPSGVQYWTTQLEQGASRTAVLAGFLGSDEFTGQINTFLTQYGVTTATGFGATFIDQTGKFGMHGDVLDLPAASPGGIPLVFEPNVGQTNAAAQYLTQGEGYTTFLTSSGPVLSMLVPAASSPSTSTDTTDGNAISLTGNTPSTVTSTGEVSLGMMLVGSNANPSSDVENQLGSHSNYFIGPQADWLTDVANYKAVKYQNVYNGIDAVYQGVGQNLEYQFVVNPGASVNEIAFTFPGWHASVGTDGSLILYQSQANMTMYQAAPTIYQANGVPVYGSFVNLGDGQIGFNVGAYDHSQALVIDPTLAYSTFVGGSGDEVNGGALSASSGTIMAVDGSGNAYVVSSSTSMDFPTVIGSFDPTAPNTTESIVVFKLNAAGTALVYSTYLGNANEGAGGAVAIDSSGDAFVAGEAIGSPATQYPTTTGAFKTSPPSSTGYNIVATELGPNGDTLVYSTFLAGDTFDNAFGIAVDASGSAYITGEVTGRSLPATGGAFQTNSSPALSAGDSGYVIKLAPNGSSLDYATYLTGSSTTYGHRVVVDSSGDAYVGGHTDATDFPTTNGAFQTTLQGTRSGFISKLNPSGSALIFSTYLGGSAGGGTAQIDSLVLDSSDNVYVTGFTNATNFPTTPGAYATSNSGQQDIFVSKLDSSGSKLDASTYLGSPGNDLAVPIALDSSGNVYVAGLTDSPLYPNVNPIQAPANASAQMTPSFLNLIPPCQRCYSPQTLVALAMTKREDSKWTARVTFMSQD